MSIFKKKIIKSPKYNVTVTIPLSCLLYWAVLNTTKDIKLFFVFNLSFCYNNPWPFPINHVL